MDQNTIRLLVGVVLVGLLVAQGMRSSTRPNRRRGLYAAAAGLALLVGYGWAYGSGRDLGASGAASLAVAAALLVFAVVNIFRAYRSGELRAAREQFQDEMRRFGEQRLQQKDEDR